MPISYRVLGWLGAGGMAQVYAALDESGARVALKRLVLPTPQSAERLARELAAQHRVDHEHVLAVRELVREPQGLVLVLPFVEGPDLGALLQAGPVPLGQKLALFRQVLEGVAAIHAAGLVHRDLKPSNVLLDASGSRVVAKVADFGLVRGPVGELATLTQTGVGLGTPLYAAPEQRRDAARVDARADVWSLGVLLVELLTGVASSQPPTDDSAWAALARHLLQPDPSGRPTDASAVLAMLPETEPVSDELRSRCRQAAPPIVAQQAPAPAAPCRLPPEPDPFVGRHEELERLAEALARSRLVTVVGTAGIGKTRLCARHASLWLEDHPGGVYFCDLTGARDLDGIVMAVAHALEVPLGKADPVVQLGHALAGRGRCLVILDNFEQVASFAAQTLARWLPRAESARFLVSSRHRLGLPEELAFELDSLHHADAIELFSRRAAVVLPSFAPSAAEREAIGALVETLDRIPLAIELAASRVKVTAPSAMLARMNQRFRLLAAQLLLPGRPDRHATLRAALDWSFELLSPEEQRAFAQLSVFRGGWTAEAAADVLEGGADPLASLVAKSLVRDGDGRQSMLQSVQEYAAQKLTPEQHAAAVERHARFFASYGSEEALDALSSHGGSARRQALARELDNLLAASERSGDGERAALAALAAWSVLTLRGPFGAGAALLDRVAPRAGAHLPRVLVCAGWMHRYMGSTQTARARYEEALQRYRESGDLRGEGSAYNSYGNLLQQMGQMDEALACYERALQRARELGHRLGEGVAHGSLAGLYLERGRGDEAQESYQEALAIQREIGHRRAEGVLLCNLGILASRRGQPEQTRSYYVCALEIVREVGDRMVEGNVLGNLGNLHRVWGQMPEAQAYYEAALALYRDMGHPSGEAGVRNSLGILHNVLGQRAEAQAHYEAALALNREAGNHPSEAVVLSNLGSLHHTLGRLELAREHFALGLAVCRKVGDRGGEGAILINLGNLHLQLGQLPEAEERYEEALTILRAIRELSMEGSALTGLGHLARLRGELLEARQRYAAAVQLHHDSRDRRSEGIARGHLGAVQQLVGERELSRAAFEESERLLRELPDPVELGKILTLRAVASHETGEREAAMAHLREAERLAEQTRSTPDSELGSELARARALLHHVVEHLL